MRKCIVIIWTLLMVLSVNAQTPQEVMQQFLDKVATQTLSADFTLTTGEGLTPMTGTVQMRGDRFVLHMLGSEASYDGKTLYIYAEDANELTLTYPTEDELLTSNPILYAKALMPQCTLRFSPKANQQSAYVIDLVPKDQSIGIRSFTIRLSKATLLPQSVTIQEDTQRTTLKLTNAKYTTATPAFVLTKPKAYVNDMR